LPFETAGALRFPHEAQFNPAQYLIGLAAAFASAGGTLFENSVVTSVDRKGRWQITSGGAVLEAEHVVIATNLPMAGPVAFDERTRPRCHVAMAFRAKPGAIDGMFIGMDEPTHSLRMGRDVQGPLLVALGPTFATGQLESWVRHNLPVEETAWRWVNEDYNTADRLPYVGVPSDETKNFYIAVSTAGASATAPPPGC
jgi:glycine/D-amino acid oxidase-like deaminating enzyme